MTRSLKKSPFVAYHLLKKINKMNEAGKKDTMKHTKFYTCSMHDTVAMKMSDRIEMFKQQRESSGVVIDAGTPNLEVVTVPTTKQVSATTLTLAGVTTGQPVRGFKI